MNVLSTNDFRFYCDPLGTNIGLLPRYARYLPLLGHRFSGGSLNDTRYTLMRKFSDASVASPPPRSSARPPRKVLSKLTFMGPEKLICLEVPKASPSHGLSSHHAWRSSGLVVSVAMDDFLLKVYLPQLREKVMEVFCIPSMVGVISA